MIQRHRDPPTAARGTRAAVEGAGRGSPTPGGWPPGRATNSGPTPHLGGTSARARHRTVAGLPVRVSDGPGPPHPPMPGRINWRTAFSYSAVAEDRLPERSGADLDPSLIDIRKRGCTPGASTRADVPEHAGGGGVKMQHSTRHRRRAENGPWGSRMTLPHPSDPACRLCDAFRVGFHVPFDDQTLAVHVSDSYNVFLRGNDTRGPPGQCRSCPPALGPSGGRPGRGVGRRPPGRPGPGPRRGRCRAEDGGVARITRSSLHPHHRAPRGRGLGLRRSPPHRRPIARGPGASTVTVPISPRVDRAPCRPSGSSQLGYRPAGTRRGASRSGPDRATPASTGHRPDPTITEEGHRPARLTGRWGPRRRSGPGWAGAMAGGGEGTGRPAEGSSR